MHAATVTPRVELTKQEQRRERELRGQSVVLGGRAAKPRGAMELLGDAFGECFPEAPRGVEARGVPLAALPLDDEHSTPVAQGHAIALPQLEERATDPLANEPLGEACGSLCGAHARSRTLLADPPQ